MIVICCFLCIILCTLSKADIKTRSFTRKFSLDDKVSNIGLLTEHYSASVPECCAMCGGHCTCFGFNNQIRKCRIHQSCDPSDMTANEEAWRYFFEEGGMLSHSSFISKHTIINVPYLPHP
jgi:hypothetical protein